MVHLTSVHGHQDTRIFHKECRSLAEAGHQVALIVPHDRELTVDGVRIIGITRPRGRLSRMTLTLWRVWRAALAEQADAYHFHDPELIGVGLLLKLAGRRVIYDVHEDVPLQILSKRWIPRLLRRPLAFVAAALEWLATACFDGIVAATPAIARKFPPKKCATVQNFPILVRTRSPRGAVPFAERENLIVYAGGISTIRGARQMVEAMALLPPELGARLVLAGAFMPASLEDELRALPGWTAVEYVGYLSQDGVRALLARCRVGLALLHPVPNYVECYSTKSFEYMEAGLPVVASDFPLWREVLAAAGGALLVDPLDPRQIAAAIRHLLTHPADAEQMGRLGQAAVRERYRWDREARRLLGFYAALGSPHDHVRSWSP